MQVVEFELLTPRVRSPVSPSPSSPAREPSGAGAYISPAPVLTPAAASLAAQVPASTNTSALSPVRPPAAATGMNTPALTPAAPVTVPVHAPTPAPVHTSVNLLDWDDAPAPAAAPPTPVAVAAAPAPPRISLIECAGRFTPVLFQQLWGRLPEAYAGRVCTVLRKPSAASELEAALRTQKVGTSAKVNMKCFAKKIIYLRATCQFSFFIKYCPCLVIIEL